MSTIPQSLCLLRLSALGDVTHVVPLVRTLQRHWPQARLHWVIDKGGFKLLEGLEGVTFHTYDKKTGLAGSSARNARRRSKDLHGLVINERIPDRPGIHVLDAIGSFCEPLGLKQTGVTWDLPVPADAHAWARAQWPTDAMRTLVISPCSSHERRNWYADRYAAVADHAAAQGWRIVLCGGRSDLERRTADAIIGAMRAPALDLVGKDTLKQLPALLARADLVMTPDSGPMHIANAMGTAVLGLHAASNPLRSGPYSSVRYCVDRYDDAARRYRGKPASELKWGAKIEHDGVMALITVDDAIAAFERRCADLAA